MKGLIFSNHGKPWTPKERISFSEISKKTNFIDLCSQFGRRPNGIYFALLQKYRINAERESAKYDRELSIERINKYSINNETVALDNNLIVMMKVYKLFKNINHKAYGENVIKVLRECINCNEFLTFSDERKGFYLSSMCEIYRRLDDFQELIIWRKKFEEYNQTNIFNLYKTVLDKEEDVAKNDHEIFDVYSDGVPFQFNTSTGFPKLVLSKISSKFTIQAIEEYHFFSDYPFTYHEVYGITTIPYYLFDLQMKDLINHSKFLEDVILLDIIKSHFSKEYSKKILSHIES